MADTTLSLPSLAVLLALSFLAVRYFFLAPSAASRPPPSSSSAAGARAARPVDLARVDAVARMFPQLDRRAIAWDLARTGGSVQATTDRMLERGALERPPPSYNPASLRGDAGAGAAGGAGKGGPAAPDLIARYNLGDRVREEGGAQQAEKSKDRGWASTKTERAALLARRREDMVLKARRDMEARVRREKDEAAGMVP